MKDEDDTNNNIESDYPEWEITDRKRGILTQFDRELLSDQKDLEGQELRNARYRTRERIIEALNDLVLISLDLDEEELEKVFNHDRTPPRSSLTSLFAKFAYQTVQLDDKVDDKVGEFREDVADALFHYYEDKIDRDENPETRYSVEVDIEVQREEVDLDALEYKIQRGEATPVEAMKYYDMTVGQEGRTARSEAADLIAEEIFDES